jgi:hypothetical protein
VKLSVKVLAKLTQILTELVQILIEPRGGELTFGEPKFFRSFNSDPRLQFRRCFLGAGAGWQAKTPSKKCNGACNSFGMASGHRRRFAGRRSL